ncbi:MAG: class I SAM-dependent methyltransferase [Eubacteriales bacterium]|nr:class I SAM-dependent methyltransferase [Eubacteriales bacterium]
MINELSVNCGITKGHAYAECLACLCGLDVSGKDKAFFRDYYIPMIKELEAAEFENDPFCKNIGIPSVSNGKWALKMISLKPCEVFVRDDFLVTDDKRLIPRLGFFTQEFKYPAVLENGREWMTLMPNEIVTTLPAIEKAHGNVLTYGLGLGYFTYMASEKHEVTTVTAVDISEEAISLFAQYILPQFPHGDKIRLICADAFNYAENKVKNGNFDFIFADIWHDAGDGRQLYHKIKIMKNTARRRNICTGLKNPYSVTRTKRFGRKHDIKKRHCFE